VELIDRGENIHMVAELMGHSNMGFFAQHLEKVKFKK
jgi:hypothetical protein